MATRRKDDKNRILKEGEYQRTGGTYEFKWRDKRGNRHSISAPTLEELRTKEDEVRRDALDGIRSEMRSLTINDLYDLWYQLKRGLKDNTRSNYIYMYTHFVAPDFGKSRIADLKRSDVRAFYNYLAEELHIKVSTLDSIHSILHQVIQIGVDDEYIRYNPADNALKELKKARNFQVEKRKALTIPQQELFEKYLGKNSQYHKWYPVFVIMMWTGMRVGEICGLRWCDINLEEETISVNHTLVYYKQRGSSEKCNFVINTPKTKAGERIIPMLPIVKEAFIMEKEYQKEAGLTCQAIVDGYTDFIFINRFGEVQHQGTLNKALRRIIRDCNFEALDREGKEAVTLPPFSNHNLRHTFATRLCETGVNIKVIQEILGHSDIEVTLDIYTDATKDFKRSEMNNFADSFTKLRMAQLIE